MTRWIAALAIITILEAVPRDARAAEDPAAAAALFKEGVVERDAGRFKEACDRFARSEELERAVGTLLNLGECFERQHLIASSYGAYREAEALALQRKDPRAKIARENAERLEPRLSRLTVSVDGKVGSIPSLVVRRNDTVVSTAVYNVAVPVDAGRQAIAASAPDHDGWESSIDVPFGPSTTVVRIPALKYTGGPRPERPPSGATGEGQRKAGIGLEIGGGVVLAAGLVFGGLAISKWSTVTNACPSASCATDADRQRFSSDVDDARTFAAVSTIATAIGVVTLAAGLLLHLTAPSSSSSSSPGAHASSPTQKRGPGPREEKISAAGLSF